MEKLPQTREEVGFAPSLHPASALAASTACRATCGACGAGGVDGGAGGDICGAGGGAFSSNSFCLASTWKHLALEPLAADDRCFVAPAECLAFALVPVKKLP